MDVAYASARDRLGQTLCGKYHLDEVLGVGGTAVVFRATHADGTRVAVKLLHDHLCKSHEITRRFMREAYLANLLEHPGTVRVLDDDVDENGVVFLVLEMLDGETLEERRVRLGGRLVIDEVLGYADRLLEVLELAHEKQIVHRDIKPSNLFLTKDGTLKVLDFGIARILDQHGGATSTKTGQMIGTPAFMPPEQALSKPKEIDKQTDLWSVGATMFTLLSGELVHVAEGSSEHLVKAATLQARSVARVLPGVPANVETLIGRALRFEKKDRWASAAEMRKELWRVRLDPGRPIGTTSAPPPPLPAASNASSNFPTVDTKHDSDHWKVLEMAMSLSGTPHPSAHPARRAVILSSAAAVFLVASALVFGIWVTAGHGQQPARPAAAAAGEKALPVPPPTSLDAPGAPLVAIADVPRPATDRMPMAAMAGHDAASRPSAPSATGVPVARPNPSAPKGPPGTSAAAKPGGKGPTTASNPDLYKPF